MIRSSVRSAVALTQATLDRRLKVAYVGGWTGKQNLGDEALLPAVRKLFPKLALMHFPGGRLARGTLRAMPRLQCGILGGGTLIGQKGLWLEIAKEFLALKPHMVLFGTGVEATEFWPGDPDLEAWKPVLDRCSFLGVRGPISAQALQTLGYANTVVVGDPVLAFAHDEINLNPKTRTIGLNVGTADGRVFGHDEKHIAVEMIKLAQIARHEGWAVEWFVVWPKDLDITRQAAADSQTEAVIHAIYHDHEAFIRRARDLSVFVGMKLHATLLATCALTPSLMVEYRPKCRDYMQSVNQDSATIRTDLFSARTAWELVSHWDDHRQETALALASGMKPLRLKQLRLANILLPHILSPDSIPSCLK